jgi:hypothetical protein
MIGSLRLLKRFPFLILKVKKVNLLRGRNLDGLYFVLAGEVQTLNRKVARGWVLKGNVKSEGQALIFDRLSFAKTAAHIPEVWE